MPEPSSPKPNDALLRVAVALFAIGVLDIAAAFLIPLLSDSRPGLVLYLLALAAPLGLAVAVVYVLRTGRRTK